jgi:hypothetical protein
MEMTRLELRPEVPGFITGASYDYSIKPPKVVHPVLAIDGWMGDDLLASHPCFFVTERLARALKSSNLSGFELAGEVTIQPTEIYKGLNPIRGLPVLQWFQPSEEDGFDFYFEKRVHLKVSPRAWDLLKSFNVLFCELISNS